MRPCRYRIIVSGQLSEKDREEFGDLRIERHGMDTALIRELDQPGLRSVIERIKMAELEPKRLSLAEGTS